MASNPMLVYVLDEVLANTLKETKDAQYLFERFMGDKKVWVFADTLGKLKQQNFSRETLFFTDKMTFQGYKDFGRNIHNLVERRMGAIKKYANFQVNMSLDKKINSNLGRVKVMVCHTGKNLNYSKFSKESLEKALHSLEGIPLVGEFKE